MNKNSIKGHRLFLPIFLSLLFYVSFCVYGSEEKDLSIDIVHPCTDYGFKRAFHDQHVACGFLNTVLDLHDENAITTVRFLDKELLSHESLRCDFIIDILCNTKGGRRLLIEIQNDFRTYYATKAFTKFCHLIAPLDAEKIHQEITEESRKRARASETYDGTKEFWKDIKTSIVLVITNKRVPPPDFNTLLPVHAIMEEIINSHRMMHETHIGRPLGDLDARVVLVMLGNFTKRESELTSLLDRWLYAFKDETLSNGVFRIPAYKHIENLHSAHGDDPDLVSFYNTMSQTVIRMTGELESFEKNIYEVNTILDLIKERAREEGQNEAKRSTAHKMLLAECPVDLITKITKLSKKEIESLQIHAVSDLASSSSSSATAQFSEGKK